MKTHLFPSTPVLCLVALAITPWLQAATGTISLKELETASPFVRDSAAIGGISLDSPLEFRGVIGAGKDASLGFYDTEKKISFWVRADGTDGDPDLKVTEYNPDDDEAPIKISYIRQPSQPPRNYSLVLKTAQIVRVAAPNANRTTQQTQPTNNNAANNLLTALTQLTQGAGAAGNAGGFQGQQGQRGQQGQQGQRGGAQAGGARAGGGAAAGGGGRAAGGAAAGGGGAAAGGGRGGG
jgi:hypothetical protein